MAGQSIEAAQLMDEIEVKNSTSNESAVIAWCVMPFGREEDVLLLVTAIC